MDRVSACGAEDTSSIPVGRTFRNHAKAWFFCAHNRTCFPVVCGGKIEPVLMVDIIKSAKSEFVVEVGRVALLLTSCIITITIRIRNSLL